ARARGGDTGLRRRQPGRGPEAVGGRSGASQSRGLRAGLAARAAPRLGRRVDSRRAGSPGRTSRCRDGGSGMKRLRAFFLGTALATSLVIAGPVSADLPVIDISNLKQSILTAAHTLQEVNNQI